MWLHILLCVFEIHIVQSNKEVETGSSRFGGKIRSVGHLPRVVLVWLPGQPQEPAAGLMSPLCAPGHLQHHRDGAGA